MPAETLRVTGLTTFIRACDRAGPDTKKEVRSAFRDVGTDVQQEAARLFDRYDERSAAGYRVSVRQTGVSVYQSIRKTTGTRPDYGALQMRRALLPALAAKESATDARFELAMDRVADNFES